MRTPSPFVLPLRLFSVLFLLLIDRGHFAFVLRFLHGAVEEMEFFFRIFSHFRLLLVLLMLLLQGERDFSNLIQRTPRGRGTDCL